MSQLTAQQASDLSTGFLSFAQSIGTFRQIHWNDLSASQHALLARQHAAVLNFGENILALSTALVMDDAKGSLSAIQALTEQTHRTLATLSAVEKGINITAAIVKLGAAIISENPFAIAGAVGNLSSKLNTST